MLELLISHLHCVTQNLMAFVTFEEPVLREIDTFLPNGSSASSQAALNSTACSVKEVEKALTETCLPDFSSTSSSACFPGIGSSHSSLLDPWFRSLPSKLHVLRNPLWRAAKRMLLLSLMLDVEDLEVMESKVRPGWSGFLGMGTLTVTCPWGNKLSLLADRRGGKMRKKWKREHLIMLTKDSLLRPWQDATTKTVGGGQ